MSDVERKRIECDGCIVDVDIVSRPFREAREVMVYYGGETITISEFGFGDEALIEKVKSLVNAAKRQNKG